MDGFDALARKAALVADLVSGDHLRGITTRVAVKAKADALTAIDADLPGRKFTNWRPRLGVGFDLEGDGVAVVKPRPGGVAKVLDEGRSPGSRFSRRAGRVVAWGPTAGRSTWTGKAAPTIVERTPERVAHEVHAALAKVFG